MFKFTHAADVHLDSQLRGLERYKRALGRHTKKSDDLQLRYDAP